jgi:H+/Cl- antiporter ClcA
LVAGKKLLVYIAGMRGTWVQAFWTKIKFVVDLLVPKQVRTSMLQAIPFWIASLLTGLIAVSYTKVFDYAETLLTRILQWNHWAIFVLAPLCFLLAWLMVRLFAPNAKGSGIPQVMAAIELATPRHEQKLGTLLSIRILVVKIISSFLMVLGGGAIGREGPTIQIAGSVFYAIHKRIPASWPRLSNQSFILTGAAAGLAAAFNTPLGGLVFAMEELARVHIRFFRTALFSAVIIAGLTAQGLLGPYLYIGYPDVRNLSFSIFFSVAATALLAGIGGALMCKVILAIMRWKKGFTLAQNIAFILVAGGVLASAAFFVDEQILGSGHEHMNTVLFTGEKHSPWYTVVMRMGGPILSFNIGAAGGVFAPSLAGGASIGSWLAGMFDFTGANANILILGGMVGFLTGVTRTPFTSAILVLEMTDRHSVIFHLLVAAMVANIAALLIDKRSFYEQLKKGYMEAAGANKPE